jgi:hypothetical protein
VTIFCVMCHDLYRKERRNLRAGKACRLCGRPTRQPRKEDPVLSGHSQPQNLLEGKL